MGKLKSIFKLDPNSIVNNIYAALIYSALAFIALSIWGKRLVLLNSFLAFVATIDAPQLVKSILGFILPALGLGFIIWLMIQFFFSLWSRAHNTSKRPTETTVSVAPNIPNRFSHHLDECMREAMSEHPEFKLTGLGLNFLKAIKSTPPFLGLNSEQYDPVISWETEGQLTQFFLATEFFGQNKDHIRGGIRYQVKPNDTVESIALDQYGNVKYANAIREANRGGLPFSTGQGIRLPFLDIGEPPRFSSQYIERAFADAGLERVAPALNNLMRDYHVSGTEALFIMGAAYGAAERTRKEIGLLPPTGSPYSQK